MSSQNLLQGNRVNAMQSSLSLQPKGLCWLKSSLQFTGLKFGSRGVLADVAFEFFADSNIDQWIKHVLFQFFLSIAVQTVLKWTKSRTSTMAQLPGNQSETLMNKCPIKMCSTKSYWITLFFLYATDWLECAEVIWRLCYGLLKELLLLGRAWPGRGMGFAAKSLLFLGSLRLAVSLAPGDCAFVAWRNDRELRTQKVSLNKGSRHFQRISTCTAE